MSCGRKRKDKRKHPSRDLLHIAHIERSIEDLRENIVGHPELLEVRWNLLATQRALQTLFESVDNRN